MIKKISIIIPALNEESHIAECLSSIFHQNCEQIQEVIVADGGSKDNTSKVAKEFNVKIISGGLPNVARNNGAKYAKGEYLLFLDADTILPHGFLKKAIVVFEKKQIDVASFYLSSNSNNPFIKTTLAIYNLFSSLAIWKYPLFLTAGCCMLVKSDVHKAVGGFSHYMAVLEEYDYVQKIKLFGKFRVIRLKVNTSMRRFQKGKYLRQSFILLFYYFQWLINRKISLDHLGYWDQ